MKIKKIAYKPLTLDVHKGELAFLVVWECNCGYFLKCFLLKNISK
jgi:hypothetical protein